MTSWTTAINPATGDAIETFSRTSAGEVEDVLRQSVATFDDWKRTTTAQRAALLHRFADELSNDAAVAAENIVTSMGKPIVQARREVLKCIDLCRYYAEHIDTLLAPDHVSTEARASYVRVDPLGPILGIMPWNFPYWQVLRWGVPTLVTGNTLLLKHADNVLSAAAHIDALFARAGAPDGLFQSLSLANEKVRPVIEDRRVRGVSLTGSVRAGQTVAAQAAGALKPTVLELGGSDACLILPDVDLDEHLDAIVHARFQNSGQTCIAAKRYLVYADIAEEFTARLIAAVEQLQTDDPMDRNTDVGPLARQDLRDTLESQVERCVRAGLTIATGGRILDRDGFFYQPTILTGVKPEHLPFHEELFGPVASIGVCESIEQMVAWANATDYGLSANVWTGDPDHGERLAGQLDAGVVFVNQGVKSDVRLPFGGIKDSGYGRELGGHGVRQFANLKTVYVA